jgi:AcrR family transcriptional regulator
MRPKLFDPAAVISKALPLFWRQGYEGTHMPELLDAMGLGKASFYNAFASKHAVFLAVLDRYFSAVDHVLAEALAGGACVVASDIPAFDDLLGHGEFGALFESESSTELAKVAIELLRDQDKRKDLSARGKDRAKTFDWTVVAEQIFSVYEMSIVGSQKVRLASDTRPWNRFLNKDEK